MADVQLGSVPFEEAIAFLKNKVRVPTQYWDDMMGAAHAKGFTVAGATKAELLADFHAAIVQVKESGGTITDFRRDFDAIVQKHGWTYNGKRGWRTRVIYDTNMRTASMAGRWQQIQRTKASRPYLQYQTVGDERVRPQHRDWDGKVLPVDDPWWSTHYPPNGWGCRCTVRSLSKRQVEREGLAISDSPKVETVEKINLATGETYGQVPVGIDPGWDYHVGQAWLGPDIAFGQRLMAMPAPLRDQALRSAQDLAPHLQERFAPWINSLLTRKQPLGEIRTVGYLTPETVAALERLGSAPTTAVITAADAALKPFASSAAKKSLDLVRQLPTNMAAPVAVLLDQSTQALIYVFNIPGAQATRLVAVVEKGSITALEEAKPEDLVKGYELVEGGL